jgi:cytochrome c biogenesis protein CcdA
LRRYIILTFFILNILLIHSQSGLKIDPLIYDFGSVSEGKIISKEISFYNETDKKINVSVHPTCGCLAVGENRFLLNEHSSKKTNISFNTNGYEGFVVREISIITDDPNNPFFNFKIEGKVTKKIEIIHTFDFEPKKYIIFANNFNFEMISDTEILFFFAYKSCRQCEPLLDKIIKWADIQNQHQKVNIYFYQLEDPINKGHVYEISKKIGYYPELPLVIYYENYYSGKNQISSFIENKDASDLDKKNQITKFNSFTVFLAGLIDGINPCAFTVIILLLSYLSLRIKNRSQTLIAGIIYICSVFITYFFIGIGIFETFRMLSVFSIVSIVLKYGLTAFLFILSFLSLYDFIKVRKKESEKMILKLPEFLQNSIRKNIRNQIKDYRILIGSLILGFTVSLFELACTGQVYFPVIGYMVRTSKNIINGFGLLLIYNFAFIIPLTLVFIIAYFGVSSKKIGSFFNNNLPKVKLVFFFLFLIFGLINFFV